MRTKFVKFVSHCQMENLRIYMTIYCHMLMACNKFKRKKFRNKEITEAGYGFFVLDLLGSRDTVILKSYGSGTYFLRNI